jgi:hypothetical protein
MGVMNTPKRTFVYRPRTALDIYLWLFDYAINDDTYGNVLTALASGISKVSRRIQRLPDEVDADDECQIIENMLGTAYVVCQAQITAVAEPASRVPGQTLAPSYARSLGPGFDTNYSKVQILWALGNYFKHRDGWTAETWIKPDKKSAHTVSAIIAAGLSRGSTAICGRARKRWGIPHTQMSLCSLKSSMIGHLPYGSTCTPMCTALNRELDGDGKGLESIS